MQKSKRKNIIDFFLVCYLCSEKKLVGCELLREVAAQPTKLWHTFFIESLLLLVDSLMNTRVSQFELRPSVEPDSNRAESFPSQPECLATSSTSPVAADSSKDISSFGSESVLTKSERLSSRIPFYLIGLLLTATAIAKFWMLLTDSFADIRVGLPKEILWLSVAFEFWLAWQNFRLRDHRVMAFINVVVFASFGVFASVRLAMGYSSCGCSGSLEIPAWVFILIDLGVVTWFASSTIRRNQFASGLREVSRYSWANEKHGRSVGSFCFLIFIAFLQLPYAAPLRTMLIGESPILAHLNTEAKLQVDKRSTGQIEIFNRSLVPAKVIGVLRSCRCFELSENPFQKTIPAGGLLVLPVEIIPKSNGRLNQRIVFFLDHPKQFRLSVDVNANVLN